MSIDRARLAKLLAMTTSDNDGEALNAVRMANAMIRSADKTWDQVLQTETVINISMARSQPSERPYNAEDDKDWVPPAHLTDKIMIPAMFRAIYNQPRTDNEEFWQWLDSVHQQWIDRQRLTPKQYQGVRRTYARVIQRPA